MLWVPNPPIYLLHSALRLLDSEFFLLQSSLLLHAEYDDGKQQKLERGGKKAAQLLFAAEAELLWGSWKYPSSDLLDLNKPHTCTGHSFFFFFFLFRISCNFSSVLWNVTWLE